MMDYATLVINLILTSGSVWSGYVTHQPSGALPYGTPRWIQMSGKQNHKNNKILTNYTQIIFCFDVFCAFGFFSGSENFGFDVFAVSFATGSVNRKLQKHQNQNFQRQKKNPKAQKTSKQKMFWEYFLQFLVSRHTIDVLLCLYPMRGVLSGYCLPRYSKCSWQGAPKPPWCPAWSSADVINNVFAMKTALGDVIEVLVSVLMMKK